VRLSEENSNIYNPNFVKWTAIWAILFTIGHLTIDKVFPALFPVTYKSLTPAKQRDFGSYFFGTIHHSIVTPYFLYALVSDFFAYPNDGFRFEENHFDTVYSTGGMLTFSFGFFIGDTLGCYVPRLFRGQEVIYFFHHLLAIYALQYYRCLKGQLLVALHVMLVTEVSTCFFNYAWMSRTLMSKSMPAVVISTLEYAFAVSFFLVRIVHIPFFLSQNWNAFMAESVIFTGTVLSGLALQFFWFYKILKSIFVGREKKEKKTNKD
jgi:hypothetical protein